MKTIWEFYGILWIIISTVIFFAIVIWNRDEFEWDEFFCSIGNTILEALDWIILYPLKKSNDMKITKKKLRRTKKSQTNS